MSAAAAMIKIVLRILVSKAVCWLANVRGRGLFPRGAGGRVDSRWAAAPASSRGRIGERSVPAPPRAGRSLGRRNTAVGKYVENALAAGEQIVGDDPAMASPP